MRQIGGLRANYPAHAGIGGGIPCHLQIWSHVAYDVDRENGLMGEPDDLIAPRTQYGDMGAPPLCVHRNGVFQQVDSAEWA